ncbi:MULTISPECIES: DUF1543 domain-containing protein [Neokomagataea]|nr:MULTISPECIES: DUF1543 domain-containing protein [Neokomagataea]MBR0559348.1 DUF1543 domain-containing protein [Neokomagataea anthophila]
MLSSKKLFIFYLGGDAPGANIEVHDVQFAAVERPEEAHPLLIEKWFGTRDSLHLDAYGIVTWADGHAVSIHTTPSASTNKLYFINMGGYTPGALCEDHAFTFLVAPSAEEAKTRAKQLLLTDRNLQHHDNLMDIDDCILIDKIDGLFIHLEPHPTGTALHAEWQGYQPI